MMRQPMDSSQRMQAAFTRLSNMDDVTLRNMIRDNASDSRDVESIITAFRAMVTEHSWQLCARTSSVRQLGIIGGSSVPTAYWPYLVLAWISRVPVKVKVPAENVNDIEMLIDLITRGLSDMERDALRTDWQITDHAGPELLASGYWDDCDRIVVFGSDRTVETFRQHFPEPNRVIGCGHLESILIVDVFSLQSDHRWIQDLLAFGHVGCLAPRLVIALGNESAECIAEAMLSRLQGLLTPDIGRAIALRNAYHAARVAGQDAWLSPDGMWLVSCNVRIPTTPTEGHLHIVVPGDVLSAECKIGSFSKPASVTIASEDLQAIQLSATWVCDWGFAQYPSMQWVNGGISVSASLS